MSMVNKSSASAEISIGTGTVWAMAHTDFWPRGPPMYLAHTEFFKLFKDWSRECNQYSLHSMSMGAVIMAALV